MKLLAICLVVLLGVAAFVVAHPYFNGVAYTHQRECERGALLDVAYAIAKQRDVQNDESQTKTLRQIVEDSPKPIDIDDSRFGVTMAWDILDRNQYNIGETDKTILLFPDTAPSTVVNSGTPLIAHVSSSFTADNDNCVLLVLAAPEVSTLFLTNEEMRQLLGCVKPTDAAKWYTKLCNKN